MFHFLILCLFFVSDLGLHSPDLFLQIMAKDYTGNSPPNKWLAPIVQLVPFEKMSKISRIYNCVIKLKVTVIVVCCREVVKV